jgi:hypothetical protein
LKCAFWQSLEQYVTLWHLRHCFGLSGDLAQWAHVGVDDDEDDGSVVSAVFVVSAVALEESARSAMIAAKSNIYTR